MPQGHKFRYNSSMCYSAEVSAGTFFFVSFASIFLWARNNGIDRALAGILFFIGLMQVFEWFLWSYPECDDVKKTVTQAIPVYLLLQPVAVNLFVWFFNAGWASGYEWVAAACLLGIPWGLMRARANWGVCVKEEGGHLVWPGVADMSASKRLERFLYYAAMLYPLLTLKNRMFSALYVIFAVASWYLFTGKSPDAWPSLWCHFVNLLAVFAIGSG